MSVQRRPAASLWSVAAERRAKRSLRSLQPGTAFPRSLPPATALGCLAVVFPIRPLCWRRADGKKMLG
jgi:hypothetical protein